MTSADYLPLSLSLPHLYREDQESFAQLDAYLGLADDLDRAVLGRLEQAEHWLSPEAASTWPPGLGLDAGETAALDAVREVYDELAGWFAFRFPVTWTTDPRGLERRREVLRRAAHLWRRRGTPRGLVEWFRLAFDVPASARPLLVEHFKAAGPPSGQPGPGPGATLFVPSTPQFTDVARRREAIAFVDRYSPASVDVRVCWTDPERFTLGPVPGPGATTDVVTAYREHLREVLCSVVSFVDHANAIRVWECVDAGRAQDRLGVGKLPGAGVAPEPPGPAEPEPPEPEPEPEPGPEPEPEPEPEPPEPEPDPDEPPDPD